MFKLSSLIDEWKADAEAAHDAYSTGKPRGALTGITRLDRELGGALAPGVHILQAGTGVGKTAFALNMAASAQCPSLYVSAEMGRLELFRRLTARVTGVFLGRLKSGELDPQASLGLAKQTAQSLPNIVLVDCTQAYGDPAWLRDCGEVARGSERHLLVVVDSVHSWAEMAPGNLGSEYDVLNAGLAALRTLAHQLDCALVGIAERNRASAKAGGVGASAGTRKFEFGAESMLELHRDEDEREDAGGEVSVSLKISKNRHGSPGGKVNLKFQGATQRWREVD